jgi:hypothetical protein
MVKFNKERTEKSLAENLAVTIPTLETTGNRTHVDVLTRSRNPTVYKQVPIEFLDPIHPAGVGDTVTIIRGEGIGGKYRVAKVEDAHYHVVDPEQESMLPYRMKRSWLASLSRM